MSWSYASSAPESSDRSYIRLRLGDNSSGAPLFSDEELDAFLTLEGHRLLAAASAAESLGARYARRTDKTVGRLRIAGQQAGENFFALAKRLRYEAGCSALPYAGGISVSDKAAAVADDDLVQSQFGIGMHDFTGGPDSTSDA